MTQTSLFGLAPFSLGQTFAAPASATAQGADHAPAGVSLIGSAVTGQRLYAPGDSLAGDTFARTGAATQTGSTGHTLSSVATGVVRDAHYIAGVRTLLIEATGTNYATDNDDLDSGEWSNNGSFTYGIADPMGGTDAARLTMVGGTECFLRQGVLHTTGQPHRGAVWARAAAVGGAGFLRITSNDQSAWDTGQSTKIALTADWQRLDGPTALSVPSTAMWFMVGNVDASGAVDATCNGDVELAFPQSEVAGYATTTIVSPTFDTPEVRNYDRLVWDLPSSAAGTRYHKYIDLATNVEVEEVVAYSGDTIVLDGSVDGSRAYESVKWASGTRDLAYMQALSDVATVAETVTATETETANATFVSARADTATAAETQTGLAVFSSARAETVTASDSASGLATFAGVRAESGTAAETETATAVFVGARAESGSAAESETATADFSAARAEVGSAAESETATAVFAGARAEALSATATDAASADFASARAESLTAAETTDATVSGGAVYDVTVDEAGAASDVQSSTADFTGLATEALAALEFESAAATFAGSVPETLAAADEQTGELAGLPTTYDVSVAESLSVVDSSDALEPAMGGGGGGFSQPYPKRPGFHITVTPPPAIWDWVVPRVRVVVGARRVVTAPARREWVVPAAVVALGTVRPFLAPARAEWVALTPEVSSAPDRAEELLILSLAVGL